MMKGEQEGIERMSREAKMIRNHPNFKTNGDK